MPYGRFIPAVCYHCHPKPRIPTAGFSHRMFGIHTAFSHTQLVGSDHFKPYLSLFFLASSPLASKKNKKGGKGFIETRLQMCQCVLSLTIRYSCNILQFCKANFNKPSCFYYNYLNQSLRLKNVPICFTKAGIDQECQKFLVPTLNHINTQLCGVK